MTVTTPSPDSQLKLADVVVVGAQALTDLLNTTDAKWKVHPAVPTIDAMWDALDSGALPTPQAVIFTYGTAPTPQDFAINVAAFAPFADIFVVTSPEMAETIQQQIIAAANQIENGDPTKPIHILPANDLNTSLSTLKTVTSRYVDWTPPQPEQPAPIIVSHPEVGQVDAPVAPPAPNYPAPNSPVQHTQTAPNPDQAPVYAPHIHEQATQTYQKPATAIPGQATIAVMSSKGGSGKCLRQDTTFVMNPATGVLHTGRETLASRDAGSVPSFDGRFVSAQHIANYYDSGVKETFRVVTRSGREVDATGNHPLLTADGWRALEDIAVGETIAVPARMPFPEQPVRMSDLALQLLYSEPPPAGFEPETRSFMSGGDTLLGVRGIPTSKRNMTVPEAIFRLPEDQLTSFMAMFWVTYGHVTDTEIGAAVISERIARDLQHLLLRLGVQSSIVHDAPDMFDGWLLTVHPAHHHLFSNKVPVWGTKEALLEKLSASPATATVTMSEALFAAITEDTAELAHRVAERLGEPFEGATPRSVLVTAEKGGMVTVNVHALQTWCELAGSSVELEHEWLYNSEIFWDEIVSVESQGYHPVFDLEIPDTLNFVANDVVVHNSTTALALAGMIAKGSAAAGNPKKVVVVDLDTRDGQIGSLIGQYVPTAVNVRVLPRWDANAVLANLVHDKRLGVDALLAPIRPRNADDVGPEFYSVIIQVLQTTHDVVILDCSVNYLDPLLGVAFGLSDEILFVTTLAISSVQGMARALIELFAKPEEGGLGIRQEKVGVVANMVINNVGMGKDKLLQAALGAPLVGQIPAEQDAVLVATNSNRMADLLKHPKLGVAYYKLATTCLPGWPIAPLVVEQPKPGQQPGDGEGPKKKGGFFKR